MTMPGSINNYAPPGDDYLVQRLAAIERDLAMLKTARTQLDTSTALVQIAGDHQGDASYAVATGAGTLRALSQIVVPSGPPVRWSRVLLIATLTAAAYNSTNAQDTFWLGIGFTWDGSTPDGMSNFNRSTAPPLGSTSCAVQLGAIITPGGVAGSTEVCTPGTVLKFNAKTWTSAAAWAANASNNLDLIVQAMFLR